MRKRFIALSFVICLIAAATVAPAQQAAQWSRFSPPEGRFAVSMPGQPSREDLSKETRAGEVVMHVFTVRADTGIYVVAYADYPFWNRKRELDVNRDRFLKGMKATLNSESDIRLQGHPGREISAWRDQLTIRSRMYLVGQRYYQMFVIVPTAYAGSGEADKFFASFELVGNSPASTKK